MKYFIAMLAFLLAAPTTAMTDPTADTSQLSRIERHRLMAEKRIHQHQAMTTAHMAGQTPVCPEDFVFAENPIFFSPAFGESVMSTDTDGEDDVALNEMRMYWQKIPDFGIKRYEIFPSETGWAQVLYWSGTSKDGSFVHGEEADIFKTDENFRIVRIENHHDWQQWKTLAAFALGKDPKTFGKADYGAAIYAQAKSPTEVCRPDKNSLQRVSDIDAPIHTDHRQ